MGGTLEMETQCILVATAGLLKLIQTKPETSQDSQERKDLIEGLISLEGEVLDDRVSEKTWEKGVYLTCKVLIFVELFP